MEHLDDVLRQLESAIGSFGATSGDFLGFALIPAETQLYSGCSFLYAFAG